MYFDIGFIILFIIFVGIGYRAGLISMILSIGAVVVSLVLSMYISSQWLVIDYPIFGYWIQTFILFVIIGFILRKLIDLFAFEKVAFVGFFSRLLGGILYGVIFSGVVFFLVLVVLTFSPSFLAAQFPNSYVIAWIRDAWSSIQAVGGLPKITQSIVERRT